ncbi:MAG: SDR family NAD(P)-dependent oxidoreductase, partial [Acidimicrobiales bacterium]
YRVGVFDVDRDRAEAVARSLPDAIALPGSVTSTAEVEAALDRFGAAPAAFVNNAGIVRFGPLTDIDEDEWRAVLETNLTGTFLAGRAAARRMMAAGGGSIINIASINGVLPGINGGPYPASKAGIAMLTSQMALEWGPSGVRVNSVAPGLIDGGMGSEILADEETRRGRTALVPLGRLGSVEDVADAVLFLASDRSSYLNGTQLVVDGGIVQTALANLPRPAAIYEPDSRE